MFTLERSSKSSTATVVSRGASPLSSDGSRLTIDAKPARPHQHGFGMRFRLERRWRHHHARDRLFAPGKIADHILDVVNSAKHRNTADRLAAIGRRRRQYADRP